MQIMFRVILSFIAVNILLLIHFIKTNNLFASHGMVHAYTVAYLAFKCIIAQFSTITFEKKISIIMAGLMHDIDDRKLVGETNSKLYLNAKRIMTAAKVDAAMFDSVITQISLVAYSSNGNEVDLTKYPLWMYIVRYCDRDQCIGPDGMWRTFMYNIENRRNIYVATTVITPSKDEIEANLLPERSAQYVSGGGISASMIDHCFDKLLHVLHQNRICQITFIENRAVDHIEFTYNFIALMSMMPRTDCKRVQYAQTREVLQAAHHLYKAVRAQ